jgi:hypothetical protein
MAKRRKTKTPKRRRKARKNPPKDFQMPIAETILWIAQGERLLKAWGAARQPYVRAMLRKLELFSGRVENEADKLHELRRR